MVDQQPVLSLPAVRDTRIATTTPDDGVPAHFRRVVSFHPRGGRLNPEIMKALSERLPVPVTAAEDHGWRGDSIEAEAFAFLGARVQRGLPISFPKTTGVPEPLAGGRIVRP